MEFPEAKYRGTRQLIMTNVLVVENVLNTASLEPMLLKRRTERTDP
jgi:hypothetical protein